MNPEVRYRIRFTAGRGRYSSSDLELRLQFRPVVEFVSLAESDLKR